MEKDLEDLCDAVTAWYVDKERDVAMNDLIVPLVATVVQLQERVAILEQKIVPETIIEYTEPYREDMGR